VPRCAWRATDYTGANSLTVDPKIREVRATARSEMRLPEPARASWRVTTTAA